MDTLQSFLAAYGLAAVFVLSFAKAAGAPLPPPMDVIMLVAAGAAAQGDAPLWLAAAVLFIALFLGGLVQFALVRGPGRKILTRYGRYLGLGPKRLEAASGLLAKGGSWAIAVAVFTPGARAASVAACGIAAVPMRTFLPGLAAGNAAVLLLHFSLGYLGGALLPDLASPAVIAGGLILLLALAAGAWFAIRARRRRNAPRSEVIAEALEAWEEAACPVCLLVGAASRVAGVQVEAVEGRAPGARPTSRGKS